MTLNAGNRKFRNAPNEMLSESTGEVGRFAEHLGEWCPGTIQGEFHAYPNLDATLVTSLCRPDLTGFDNTEWHMPVLDLDIDHVYYESTTPGHAALLLNVTLPAHLHWKLMEVLEECGIIEPGFAEASRQRGYAAVRTPWTKKPAKVEEPVSTGIWGCDTCNLGGGPHNCWKHCA